MILSRGSVCRFQGSRRFFWEEPIRLCESGDRAYGFVAGSGSKNGRKQQSYCGHRPGLILFLFVSLDLSISYGAPGPLEVSGCPLNREVVDLFRMLVDSTLILKISANGCNLTGTLADPSSFRQGNCRNRLATN